MNATTIKVKDSTAAVADTGATLFNTKYLSGGFYRDELDIAVRATGGTCYLVVDNEYTPGQDVDVWLSSDGEGGRDGGDVEKYVWALPESLAISAGAATTVVQNFVYLSITPSHYLLSSRGFCFIFKRNVFSVRKF